MGFHSREDQAIKKVPIAGGAAETLATGLPCLRGAAWGFDETIVLGSCSANHGLSRVSAQGGELEKLTETERGEHSHRWPVLLNGGRDVLFTVWRGGDGRDELAIVRLDSLERVALGVRGSHARYTESGHLVFVAERRVFAARFQPPEPGNLGQAVPILDGVFMGGGGRASFDVARDGTLVYIRAPSKIPRPRKPVWVSRRGQRTAVDIEAGSFFMPRISPDGARLLLDARHGDDDLWVLEFGRGSLTRLTSGPAKETSGSWLPSGDRIVYVSVDNPFAPGGSSLAVINADGSRVAESLTAPSDEIRVVRAAVSRDGRHVLQTVVPRVGVMRIEHVQISNPAPTPLFDTNFLHVNGELSPDGLWFVYQSEESGRRDEIFVRPFPDADKERWQVSNNGGSSPAWVQTAKSSSIVKARR